MKKFVLLFALCLVAMIAVTSCMNPSINRVTISVANNTDSSITCRVGGYFFSDIAPGSTSEPREIWVVDYLDPLDVAIEMLNHSFIVIDQIHVRYGHSYVISISPIDPVYLVVRVSE